MLGCRTRGFSFTRALLGLSADELHLCGDPAAVPLIQEILRVTGDDVEVIFLLELYTMFNYVLPVILSEQIIYNMLWMIFIKL